MTKKKALKYIHEHKKHGVEDHTIKSSFSRVGWHPDAISSLFGEYGNYKKKLHKKKKNWMLFFIWFLIIIMLFLIFMFIYVNLF